MTYDELIDKMLEAAEQIAVLTSPEEAKSAAQFAIPVHVDLPRLLTSIRVVRAGQTDTSLNPDTNTDLQDPRVRRLAELVEDLAVLKE